MEKTHHLRKRIHRVLCRMDGGTIGSVIRSYAIRACDGGLPKTGREFPDGKGNTDPLRDGVPQKVRSDGCGRCRSLLECGRTAMDNIPGGELYGMETDSIDRTPQITRIFTDELFLF